MHVQTCCFDDQTYCFFDVLAAVAIFVAKAPYFKEQIVTKSRRLPFSGVRFMKG